MNKPKSIIKYRVKLAAEDGVYTLEDNFTTQDDAEASAETHAESYGEGQEVYVEPYVAYSFGGGY